MKNVLRLISIAIMILAATACKDNKRFTITASIADIGKQSITMTYFADGKVNTVTARPAADGTLRLEGSAREPALIELSLSSTGRPLALLVARNGENVKCDLTIADPLKINVKGCKASEMVADFLRANEAAIKTGNTAAVNDSIRRFIIANPGSVASTALLVTRFAVDGHEKLADSLLNIIVPEARPVNVVENFNSLMAYRNRSELSTPVRVMSLTGSRDSVFSYVPGDQGMTLLAFTGRERTARDSVARRLKELAADYPTKRLRVLEISLIPDSVGWRKAIAADSARWTQTWVPGSAAALSIEKLLITRTPYFIVSDSTGKQLMRTPSVSRAAEYIRNHRPTTAK